MYDVTMKTNEILAKLRECEPLLREAGIVRLSLFGSTARGEDQANDVDLLAAIDSDKRLSLLDVIHIENQISDYLGQPVDLLIEGTLQPYMIKRIDKEAVRAF
jgi:predicted nucleotidyltransferase